MKRLIEMILRFLRILRVTLVRKTIHFTRKIIIPGFEGVSLWEIIFFFIWTLRRGLVTTRASSLSFHFFLAMIPFGLVMVIILTYLPYFDLEQDVLPVFSSFVPESIFSQLSENLTAFKDSTVNTLISFGFILALYFSSNGFTVLIKSFNNSKVQFEKRNFWSTKITAIIFVFVIILGMLALVILAMLERQLLHFWGEHSDFVFRNQEILFSILTAFFVAIMLYFAIATIYYFGPSNRREFRFFSAGGTLATVLIILITELYSFYIKQFATYDEVYGSLGTIMMLLLWIYLISFVLLLGFELNASIHGVVKKKHLDNLERIENRNNKLF